MNACPTSVDAVRGRGWAREITSTPGRMKCAPPSSVGEGAGRRVVLHHLGMGLDYRISRPGVGVRAERNIWQVRASAGADYIVHLDGEDGLACSQAPLVVVGEAVVVLLLPDDPDGVASQAGPLDQQGPVG